MKDSIIHTKSYAFSLRIIKLYSFLIEKKEYVMSKQLLRSWTAIWALVREAEFWQSRADFIHKLSVALKEANESEYWLSLLYDSWFLKKEEFESIHEDSLELIKMLASSVKTLKTQQ